MSYFDERIKSLNLSEADCHARLGYELDAENYQTGDYQFIRPSDIGIEIHFFDINRNIIYYDEVDPRNVRSGKEKLNRKVYKITRLENPEGDMKYKFPAAVGETYPFIPVEVCDKYKAGEQIRILYLTEGAFKAFKAAKHGLDIIGLTSITHYKQSDGTIYRDIRRLIEKCKVEVVCMLYDADCLDLSAKDLATRGDLSRRPNTFFNSMKCIYDLLNEYSLDIYFTHILKEVEGAPKGLDDLYCQFVGNEDMITKDLLSLSRCNDFSYKLNLKTHFSKLRAYFGLKSPTHFFNKHEREICNTGESSFVFYGSRYRIGTDENTGEKTVTLEMPADLNKYFRCGDDYFELVPTPTPFGEMEEVLTKRSVKTITDDFGKDAIKHIAKYKAFVNIPSNINYQRIINNCYNYYNPISHEITEGSWYFTEMFLHHIFGDYYDVGIDYLTILFKEPTQILPVLCLVSEERRTGKTTFLDWLTDIYGENACVIGSEELKSQFNGVFLRKLICGIDETSLSDNREITERIKFLSTAKVIPIQTKGKDFVLVKNFCKFIMCSNKVDSFIYSDSEEVRFFVLKVPPFEGKEITDIRKRMYDEIPAFLHFLLNRNTTYKKETRAWFAYNLIRTDAFDALCEKQKPRVQKIIETWISETMEDFELTELKMTKNALISVLPELHKYENQINDILKKMGCEKSDKTVRFKIPVWSNDPLENELRMTSLDFNGRPFIYRKSNNNNKEE